MIGLVAAAAICLAFILSLIGTILVRKFALSLGFIDQPGRDRLHSKPTPLLGGVAITAAIILPSILALVLARVWANAGAPHWIPDELKVHIPGIVAKTPFALIILAGCVLLHVVGLIDDRRHLGPWLKLAAQILAACAVVFVGDLHMLDMVGEPFSSIASILWLVLITNAFNFLDNIDGLSAGVAAICSAALLSAAVASGQLFVAGWLCLLLGASLGFLVFNFPPAKIFMGDAGSLVLGFMLGVLSILTTYYRGGSSGVLYSVFVPVVLLAVPLYDTISVVLIRIRSRRNPMIGDQRHFSHRLLSRGMSSRKAVMTIYLATAATAVGASLLPHVSQTGAILVFAQTVGIVSIIALLESADGRGKP